jgi:hypothetical protein
MKTVRFSKVVEKCGKPEVYLLMTETDSDFQKALHADKIMSLSDDSHGAGTEFGTVGYDKKRKGQLLLFPKTLKAFEEMKIVGIKYDLFVEEEADEPAPKKKAAKESQKAKPHTAKKKASLPSEKPPKAPPAKVIHFPKPEPDDEEEDESVTALKGYARQALRALEKNNSVAAYNLLKRIVGD